MFRFRAIRSYTIGLMALGSACRAADTSTKSTVDSSRTPAGADSQYTPAEMIAAFRAKVGDHATQLGGGATTERDSLVARYARALERADTSAFEPMRLSAGEFAWLYYLDSPMAQRPYELDPDVMWMQMSAQSARGLTRALQRFGGHSLGAWRATCPAPSARGTLRLYECTFAFHPGGAATAVTLPLAIVERDGRFKFVGYGNPL
jgi:hypothetical protein